MNRLLRVAAVVTQLRKALYPGHRTLKIELTALDEELKRDEIGQKMLENMESIEAAELRGYVAAQQAMDNGGAQIK